MVNSMNKAFDSIKKELNEPPEYSKGKAIAYELTSIDVKNIRAKVRIPQSEFVSASGTSVSRVRQGQFSHSSSWLFCSNYRTAWATVTSYNERQFRACCRRLTDRPGPSPHFCPAGITCRKYHPPTPLCDEVSANYACTA